MRCSGWSSLAISGCSLVALAFALALALALATPARAHVDVVPPFLAAGESESVSFTAPNERDEPMTGFAVTVPAGFAITNAHEVDGWQESLDGRTASWSGGTLVSRAEETFGMDLEAPATPGVEQIAVEQRYPGGVVTSWRVPFTVTPPAEEGSQNLALAAAVGAVGLALVGAIGALAWRRRAEAPGS